MREQNTININTSSGILPTAQVPASATARPEVSMQDTNLDINERSLQRRLNDLIDPNPRNPNSEPNFNETMTSHGSDYPESIKPYHWNKIQDFQNIHNTNESEFRLDIETDQELQGKITYLKKCQAGTSVPGRPITSSNEDMPERLISESNNLNYLDATKPSEYFNFTLPSYNFEKINININLEKHLILTEKAKQLADDLMESFNNAHSNIPEAFKVLKIDNDIIDLDESIKRNIKAYLEHPLIKGPENKSLGQITKELAATLFEWINCLSESVTQNLGNFLEFAIENNLELQRDALVSLISIMLLYKIRNALMGTRPNRYKTVHLIDIVNMTCHVIENSPKYKSFVYSVTQNYTKIENIKERSKIERNKKVDETNNEITEVKNNINARAKEEKKIMTEKNKQIIIIGLGVLGAFTVIGIVLKVTKSKLFSSDSAERNERSVDKVKLEPRTPRTTNSSSIISKEDLKRNDITLTELIKSMPGVVLRDIIRIYNRNLKEVSDFIRKDKDK